MCVQVKVLHLHHFFGTTTYPCMYSRPHLSYNKRISRPDHVRILDEKKIKLGFACQFFSCIKITSSYEISAPQLKLPLNALMNLKRTFNVVKKIYLKDILQC